MKLFNTCAILLALNCGVFAQENYSRVKIDLEESDMVKLSRLGIETDHGMLKKGRYLINDLSESEIDLIQQNEFNFEILIHDVQTFYVEQNEKESLKNSFRNEHCVGKFYDYQTPANYEFGSMGGYLTYDEMLATLDLMQSKFPHLISRKQPIGSILTEEGRPIYWLKVGNNPSIDEESKPEVLYTALHHAREANSLSQMIFYLWYLLENYESDQMIRHIVDYTELYFIPCVNPDGYVYNESTNPNGGGLWRKNRSVINGSVAGVDLNRNYGLEWGHDDEGSSIVPNSNTYRGPFAFSEPETQAVRNFCLQHDFRIALNYHTYGNLLIYPWGYNNDASPDDLTFKGLSETLTHENDYLTGTSVETVGYSVNGSSDDWMYGAASILSYTPEVGSTDYGFWPPKSAIDQLNKSALRQNLIAALIVDEHVEAMIAEDDGSRLTIDVKKYSLDSNVVSISLETLDELLTFDENDTETRLRHLETASVDVKYNIDLTSNIERKEVKFLLTKKYANYEVSDTLSIRIPRDLEEIFSDNAENLEQWESAEWGISDSFFFTDSSSFTDSPIGNYQPSTMAGLTLAEPIDFSEVTSAILEFKARWDIERYFDYAQILISVDSIHFMPLCGKHSNLGTTFQRANEPVYDGEQETWVQESISLDEYIGEKIWLRFTMVSDEVQEQDGFYIDDIYVKVVQKENTSGINPEIKKDLLTISPNPVENQLLINLRHDNTLSYSIYNAFGQLVLESNQRILDVSTLTKGIYFIKLKEDEGTVALKKFIKE